jgi:lysophospholipase L1-like esterase
VTAPTPTAPIGDAEIEGLRPELVVSNARGLYVEVFDLSYRFQITDAEGKVVSDWLVAGGDGATAATTDAGLFPEATYTWRARAELDQHVGPWSESARFRTPRRELRFTQFLAFGDSLTAGEVSYAPMYLVVSRLDAYPYRLEGHLMARYPEQTITVVNAGVPGEVASVDGRARLGSEIDRHHPEVLLLMEGTNDLLTLAPDQVIAALDDMIQEAKQKQVQVFLATIPPQRPGGRRDAVAATIPSLNDQIRALALTRDVYLVDVYQPIAANLSLIGQDDLHLTPEGYEVMAQTWFEAIIAALDPSVTAPAQLMRW